MRRIAERRAPLAGPPRPFYPDEEWDTGSSASGNGGRTSATVGLPRGTPSRIRGTIPSPSRPRSHRPTTCSTPGANGDRCSGAHPPGRAASAVSLSRIVMAGGEAACTPGAASPSPGRTHRAAISTPRGAAEGPPRKAPSQIGITVFSHGKFLEPGRDVTSATRSCSRGLTPYYIWGTMRVVPVQMLKGLIKRSGIMASALPLLPRPRYPRHR